MTALTNDHIKQKHKQTNYQNSEAGTPHGVNGFSVPITIALGCVFMT